MKLNHAIAALALSFAFPALAADYTLAVEPNYPPRVAQQVYTPLLEYLSRSTGHNFTLRTATNYHVYWRDLRSNAKTDFAFEEAHFTDYRIDRLGFRPLVRTVEGTKYLLLEAPEPPPAGTFVDLGCGYGPMACTLAARRPDAAVRTGFGRDSPIRSRPSGFDSFTACLRSWTCHGLPWARIRNSGVMRKWCMVPT